MQVAKYYIKKKEQAKARTEPDNAISVDSEVIDPLPARFENVQPPNKYNHETREEICKLVLEAGLTIKETAQKFGIARNTVSAIIREFIAEHDMIENVRLGRKFCALANKVLNELQKRDFSASSVSQLGILSGIAVDKKIQLMGKQGNSLGGISMRIAWKDGSGAVELTTGGPGTEGSSPSPSPAFHVHAGQDQDNFDPGEIIDIDADVDAEPVSPTDSEE